MENLTAASREELIAIIEALLVRVAALEEENRRLRAGELALNRLRRRRLRVHLEARLEALARPLARRATAPHGVLAQRVSKHPGELFVFVEHPEVPADNNLAERSLRPAVTAPKVSGGTRSEKGSQTKMGLLSLMGTWTLQNRALLPACRKLLLTGSPA